MVMVNLLAILSGSRLDELKNGAIYMLFGSTLPKKKEQAIDVQTVSVLARAIPDLP